MVFNTCLQLKLSPIWVVGDICSNMKGELRLCVWYWIWLCCELIFLVAYGVWAIFCCIRSFNRYFSSEYSIAASIFTIIAQNTSFSGLGKAGAGERLSVSVDIFSTKVSILLATLFASLDLSWRKEQLNVEGGLLAFASGLSIWFESSFLLRVEPVWRGVKTVL